MTKQRGFIKFIVAVIIGVLILNYFQVDIRHYLETGPLHNLLVRLISVIKNLLTR